MEQTPLRVQNEQSSTELSDLLMNEHKTSICEVPKLFVYKSIKSTQCHKMTNCEQFRIVATLTLASTLVFLVKMCQECYNGGNPECSKKYFLACKMSWNFVTPCSYYWKSIKCIVSINSHILFFFFLGVIHAKNHLDWFSGCL